METDGSAHNWKIEFRNPMSNHMMEFELGKEFLEPQAISKEPWKVGKLSNYLLIFTLTVTLFLADSVCPRSTADIDHNSNSADFCGPVVLWACGPSLVVAADTGLSTFKRIFSQSFYLYVLSLLRSLHR